MRTIALWGALCLLLYGRAAGAAPGSCERLLGDPARLQIEVTWAGRGLVMRGDGVGQRQEAPGVLRIRQFRLAREQAQRVIAALRAAGFCAMRDQYGQRETEEAQQRTRQQFPGRPIDFVSPQVEGTVAISDGGAPVKAASQLAGVQERSPELARLAAELLALADKAPDELVVASAADALARVRDGKLAPFRLRAAFRTAVATLNPTPAHGVYSRGFTALGRAIDGASYAVDRALQRQFRRALTDAELRQLLDLLAAPLAPTTLYALNEGDTELEVWLELPPFPRATLVSTVRRGTYYGRPPPGPPAAQRARALQLRDALVRFHDALAGRAP